MAHKPAQLVFAVAAFVVIGGSGHALAQDSGKKDDALDALIKELAEPQKAATKSDDTAKAKKPSNGNTQAKSKQTSRPGSTTGKSDNASPAKTGNSATPKSADAGKVAPKDQALDELLGKLGESKDEPSADERPRTRAADKEPSPPSGRDKPSAARLGGKDKDLDERLEELAGRKKKRPRSDEERSGAIGEMIKEMRDVEQKLAKPDTGEDTQKKQKQIVKRIETLIEQARQSGSSGGGFVLRRVRQQGQPGQQPGDQQGALARGAPPMKPAKPTSQHSTAGGKDIWGHLPAELRQVMENSFKETELDSKREMISRYFLSVGKGKLVREE
jgi:hypothetical protein